MLWGWLVKTPVKKNKAGEAIKTDGGHSHGAEGTVLSRIIKQALCLQATCMWSAELGVPGILTANAKALRCIPKEKGCHCAWA